MMARALLLLGALALAFMTDAFVPPLHRMPVPSRLPSKIESPRPKDDPGAVVMAVLATLAGLIMGLAAPAWAGTGGARPDFQVVRPGFMQGIDAALAATKPGEIDYVTRSRIEASYFPQVKEELKATSMKLQEAPSKQERLEKVSQQLRDYAEGAEIRMAEEVNL
mmetsp:Transcript_68412/g.160947  ORF Transcript_68412/g.160947 Transcript_68412/m.160947 type:complete len:165 (+) Transcript_68412:47-541(+)